MRVLILTPAWPTAASPAEGVFNAQHARALAGAGAEVTVVVAKPRIPEPLARLWSRYRHLAGLPARTREEAVEVRYARYLHLPGYRRPAVTVGSCARAVLAAVGRWETGPFDLVQAHSLWPTGLAAPAVAAKLGVPFVVTAHIRDDPELYRSPQGARLYRRMLREAAAKVAVGTPLVRFLEGFEDGPPVRRIANGVDLEAAAEARRAVEGAGGEGRTPWGTLVSVCNLWPLKGIDDNLKALALLADNRRPWHRYTVVGDGPDRPRLEALAEDLGIADRVRFAGRLPHRQALERVAAADLFTLPSWQESFGVAHLEAMACGKPAVGCRGQGPADVIRHGVDGLLVEPRNVESLAAALDRLLRDPPFARKLGVAASGRAGELSWGRNAARYLEVYGAVLG